MQPIKPFVTISGDSPDNIMARSGELVGFNKRNTRFVWRFGFLTGSPAANAYGVSTKEFIFVIADINGNITAKEFIGFGLDLPHHFTKILKDK